MLGLDLLWVGIAEGIVFALSAKLRKPGSSLKEVLERLVQVVDRLLQRMVGGFLQELKFACTVSSFI